MITMAEQRNPKLSELLYVVPGTGGALVTTTASSPPAMIKVVLNCGFMCPALGLVSPVPVYCDWMK